MGPRMEHDCRDAATTCINAYAPTPGNVKNGGFATGRTHLLYLLTLRTRRRATFTLFLIKLQQKAATLMGLRSLLK